MINVQYKLTSPLTLETFCENIDFNNRDVLIRPETLSVCKADIRYYFGLRNAKLLKRRLPLTLIHEASGEVLHDGSGMLEQGDRVVLLPNIPGASAEYGENYRLDSKFRSSRADGFMQEMICLPHSQVVPYRLMKKENAAVTEFVSVGIHAVSHYMGSLKRKPGHIAVWGDGGLGYCVCCLLRYFLPETSITSIGVHRRKQEMFQFVDECLTADEVSGEPVYDDAFECVGGQASGNAIAQMIDTVLPEGILMLMGVSEEPVPVNTRMVLEKGLTMIGRSRSAREDFVKAVEIMENNRMFSDRIGMLISDVMEIRNMNDMHKAFRQSRAVDFKLVMDWNV